MATMKLYELVNHYHIGTELTCAEAMFMACNEYYHLNLSEETRKMFSVMGLGMQTEQSCCGAFTVAVGIIGLMTAKEGQTDVDNMEGYQMIAELTEFMLGFYGTLHCVELQKLEIVGYENPCHAIVEALAKRAPFYSQARYRFDAGYLESRSQISESVQRLRQLLGL